MGSQQRVVQQRSDSALRHSSPGPHGSLPCLIQPDPTALGERLSEAMRRVLSGLHPEEVLDFVFEGFRDLVPFDRIGCSLLEQEGTVLRAYWARTAGTDLARIPAESRLGKGYAAPLAGSSLAPVIATGTPRILSDLEAYLEAHPGSDSTRRIVAEGLRSSMTCPLLSPRGPVGVLFFSSRAKAAYSPLHAWVFQAIAHPIAASLEKARLIEALEERDRDKDRLFRVVAHDLRGPIGAVRSLVASVLRGATGPTTPEQEEVLGDVITEVDRLRTLVQDLTDARAAATGRLTLQKRTMDLAKLVQERVHAHGGPAAQKQTRIEADAPERAPVWGDPRRLAQVVDNLVSNALKYSPPGARIRVLCARDGKVARVSVIDSGPGIPASERSVLFTEFGTTSVLPTAGEPSTGLGLSIVRHLVEAHGGSVGCESRPGQGSTFWFTLPVLTENDVEAKS